MVYCHIFVDVLVLIFWPFLLKPLFMSEASAYRKQPRDDIIRLDTAEPPEGVLQYRTDLLSPCRYIWIYISANTPADIFAHSVLQAHKHVFVFFCRVPFVPTHLPFLTDAYKTPNNDSESLLSPSRTCKTHVWHNRLHKILLAVRINMVLCGEILGASMFMNHICLLLCCK